VPPPRETVPPEGRFAVLRGAKRVWAVGAPLGDPRLLSALHDRMEGLIRLGDRLVYCGNVLGQGPDPAAALTEVLLFRRAVIARPGFVAEDVVLLRGAQEEMLHRLLQIQFARGPAAIEQALAWMARQGVGATLAAYGHALEEGGRLARQGPVQLARWTGAIRAAIARRPGHTEALARLKRAAFTVPHDLGGIAPGVLLVASGLDPERPIEAQGDALWWDGAGFARAAAAEGPWGGFARLVRGHDGTTGQPAADAFGLTLGPGLAALLMPDGEVADVVEA
jgi:hypothetical protein